LNVQEEDNLSTKDTTTEFIYVPNASSEVSLHSHW